MPKISEYGHVLTLTDGTYIDGRKYLQKKRSSEGMHRRWTGGGASDA
jgi:hypothetical protein